MIDKECIVFHTTRYIHSQMTNYCDIYPTDNDITISGLRHAENDFVYF